MTLTQCQTVIKKKIKFALNHSFGGIAAFICIYNVFFLSPFCFCMCTCGIYFNICGTDNVSIRIRLTYVQGTLLK